MEKATLVVMAAGMGSRFGGLKQIAPVGPNGEIILDFSVFDAKRAGFGKTVFIIKKAIEKDFREAVGKRIEKMCDVDYAFQEIDKIPAGFSTEGREKPWGTGHAVLCARDKVTTPFAIINADDFYGKDAFKIMGDHLNNGGGTSMVGYRLGSTLSENGTVSRGVCQVENGFLKEVVEHTALDKNSPFSMDSTVSMNLWGFTPDIFDKLEVGFKKFMTNIPDIKKSEYYIQEVVMDIIREGGKVDVLPTNECWYGVTYKEDTDAVKAAIKKIVDSGVYEGM
ncbi:MAG: sugar phosphate nucleotidyltransferase [Clostridia bacterium]|nr:sugar phosphate nucleotidyltransferase [Clostridia bacterium]